MEKGGEPRSQGARQTRGRLAPKLGRDQLQPLPTPVAEGPLARIMHETPSRDRGDGPATGQPQGLGPEAYLFSTSQDPRPDDARKDGQIHDRSRWFVHNAG
jgi:hypothetical protein